MRDLLLRHLPSRTWSLGPGRRRLGIVARPTGALATRRAVRLVGRKLVDVEGSSDHELARVGAIGRLAMVPDDPLDPGRAAWVVEPALELRVMLAGHVELLER